MKKRAVHLSTGKGRSVCGIDLKRVYPGRPKKQLPASVSDAKRFRERWVMDACVSCLKNQPNN